MIQYFFWLSLEIPRWLEPDNFIFTSFLLSLLIVIYQGSIRVGNQIAKEIVTPNKNEEWWLKRFIEGKLGEAGAWVQPGLLQGVKCQILL